MNAKTRYRLRLRLHSQLEKLATTLVQFQRHKIELSPTISVLANVVARNLVKTAKYTPTDDSSLRQSLDTARQRRKAERDSRYRRRLAAMLRE